MSRVMPPLKPPVGHSDNDGLRQVRFRIWQIFTAGTTLVFTGWFCTMGVLPAILALAVAKHVLVAILIVGLEPPNSRRN